MANVLVSVHLRIDNFEKTLNDGNLQYYYAEDPMVLAVSRNKAIVSGGLTVIVRGNGFDLLENPKMVIRLPGVSEEIFFDCKFLSTTTLECLTSPLLSMIGHIEANKPVGCDFGFQWDDGQSYRNLSALNSFPRQKLWIFPDPTFYPFPEFKRNDQSQRLKFYQADIKIEV